MMRRHVVESRPCGDCSGAGAGPKAPRRLRAEHGGSGRDGAANGEGGVSDS